MKTTSEIAFEQFLAENGLPFQRLEEQESPRPDYSVSIGDHQIFFEVKELAEDENFKTVPLQVSHRIIGDHIRAKISGARRQVQFGSRQGIPSVLLVYNNLDPIHLFGTEDMDFITAMYGENTLLLNRNTKQAVDFFQGRNHAIAKGKNTSFGAVGRLYPVRSRLVVTLFENVFANVRVAFDALPKCFEVRRFNIDYSQNV